MHPLNWVIVVGWLTYVVIHGIRRSKRTDELEGYLLANRSLPWWAVGLSVMATQLSAVTMIGTTGQGATDGMRFVQFYFGLPLAMVILGVTIVPFLHVRVLRGGVRARPAGDARRHAGEHEPVAERLDARGWGLRDTEKRRPPRRGGRGGDVGGDHRPSRARPGKFERAVVDMLDRIQGGPGVQAGVFGEMVDVLSRRGDADIADELERLWNDVARAAADLAPVRLSPRRLRSADAVRDAAAHLPRALTRLACPELPALRPRGGLSVARGARPESCGDGVRPRLA